MWDGSPHGLCWGPNDELIHAHHSTVRAFDDLHSAPRLMRLPFLARDVAISPTAKATAFGGPDQGLVLDWPLMLRTEIPDAQPAEQSGGDVAGVAERVRPLPGC